MENINSAKKYGKVGLVARFKPLHNGHKMMLEAICDNAEHVVIGLGSVGKYDVRNPFTAEESKEMVDLVLKGKYSNYSFCYVPDVSKTVKVDVNNAPAWAKNVYERFGNLDAFITANDSEVKPFLEKYYTIVKPLDLLPQEKRVRVNATMVREELARNGDWRSLVPPQVADYIKENGLDKRFRQDFGLMTLAYIADEIMNGNYEK